MWVLNVRCFLVTDQMKRGNIPMCHGHVDGTAMERIQEMDPGICGWQLQSHTWHTGKFENICGMSQWFCFEDADWRTMQSGICADIFLTLSLIWMWCHFVEFECLRCKNAIRIDSVCSAEIVFCILYALLTSSISSDSTKSSALSYSSSLLEDFALLLRQV